MHFQCHRSVMFLIPAKPSGCFQHLFIRDAGLVNYIPRIRLREQIIVAQNQSLIVFVLFSEYLKVS